MSSRGLPPSRKVPTSTSLSCQSMWDSRVRKDAVYCSDSGIRPYRALPLLGRDQSVQLSRRPRLVISNNTLSRHGKSDCLRWYCAELARGSSIQFICPEGEDRTDSALIERQQVDAFGISDDEFGPPKLRVGSALMTARRRCRPSRIHGGSVLRMFTFPRAVDFHHRPDRVAPPRPSCKCRSWRCNPGFAEVRPIHAFTAPPRKFLGLTLLNPSAALMPLVSHFMAASIR